MAAHSAKFSRSLFSRSLFYRWLFSGWLLSMMAFSLLSVMLPSQLLADTSASNAEQTQDAQQPATQNSSGTDQSGDSSSSSATNNLSQNQVKLIAQLKSLAHEIGQTRERIKQLEARIANSPSEVQNELKTKLQQLQKELKEQNYHLEQVATGAVDLSLFNNPTTEEFNWRTELEEIFKPFLYELKQITERPRQLEQLRSRISTLNSRLNSTQIAVKQIEKLQAEVSDPQTLQALTRLLEQWQERQTQLQSELQLARFQLEEKNNSTGSKSEIIVDSIKSFVSGRGLNLLLAIIAFIATFALLRYASHLVEQRIARGQNKDDRFFARLIHVVLQIMALIMALFAALTVLYAVGDWLLLTLLCIILVGLVFALRNSLPKYVDETRLLLNLGSVREGERVIYEGLPWNVSRINIYSDLVNPLLTGGRIRLPLREMKDLISRRWSREEPWFPCKPGDYVMMPDKTYGMIKLQTPESVEMEVVGGGTKLFNTLDFIAQAPHNTSRGFAIFTTFGLDYELQADITEAIPATLKTHLQQALRAQEYGQYVENVLVEFSEAGASSLDLKLVLAFTGEAAPFYLKISRFIQKATVDACNQHQWNIPFSQVTVHMPDTQPLPESGTALPAPDPVNTDA